LKYKYKIKGMSSQVLSSVDATGLFQLIEDEDWDDAILQVKQFPEEAKTWVIGNAGKSKFRRLPLHEALILNAPYEVIECLFNANPDASKACDEGGRLPLHHAVYHGTQMKAVTKLVMEFPESLDFVDKGGLKPLEIAKLGSSTEKENLVAFLSKGSLFYAVQKEENKWVQRENNLKMQLETLKKGLEDKVEAARAEDINRNEQLIAKLAALENGKLHDVLPSNNNEQTRSEQALVIEECQKRIAELETQLVTQVKTNEEAEAQLVLEPLVTELEMQVATLSAKCDKLQMEYSEKSKAYEEAIAKIELISSEKNIFDSRARESDQRLSELAEQLAAWTMKYHNLYSEYNTKMLDSVSAEKKLLQQQEGVKGEYEHRVAVLEEQVASLGKIREDLLLKNIAKTEACDESVKKIADLEFVQQQVKGEYEHRVAVLEEQVASLGKIREDLLLKNIAKTEACDESVKKIADLEFVQQQVKGEYEHRVAVLEEQVTSLGKIREDLLLKNIAKTEACDESVKKIADLEVTIAELKKSHELRYTQVTMQCLQLEELAKSKYSENLKLMEDLESSMSSQEQLAYNKLAEASLTAEIEQLQEELSLTRKELETANQLVNEADRKIVTLSEENELLMRKNEDNTKLISLVVTNASEYHAKTSQAVNILESDFAQIQTERFESVTTKYQTMLERVCT